MKLSKTKVFQKIKVNDKKYRQSAFTLLEILLIFVIEVCISLSITTFFGSRKFSQTTVTIYDHNKSANLMLGITIFITCLAIVSFYWYLTRKKEHFSYFLLGNVSLIALMTSISSLVIEAIVPQGKATKQTLTKALEFTDKTYYVLFGLTVLVGVIALIVNSSYFKRNNWYIFLSVAPSIIFTGLLFRKKNAIEQYYQAKGLTPTRILKVFKESQDLVGVKRADISLVNEYVKLVLESSYVLGVVIVLIVLGMLLVKLFDRIKTKIL